jgi:N-acetylneuraminic acid mutarotase
LWQSLAPTVPARQEVSYVTLEGKMYLAGGDSGGTLGPHEVYDPATNSWKTLTQLGGPSSPRTAVLNHIQSVALGGKIYYVGGLDSWPGPPSAKVYIYDPATDGFTMGADMPRPRGAGGVVADNGKIYVVGGLAQQPDSDPPNYVAVNWVDVYDPATNSWSQLASMPTARDHFQAAVVDARIYAIGGRQTSPLATVGVNEVYDIASNTWATGKTPIPTLRGGFATARLGRELFLIGGEGPDGSGGAKTFDDVEAYNVDTDTWRSLAPMPTPRHGISAAVCNGGIYIAAGGATPYDGSPSTVDDVLFPDGVATSCGPSGSGMPPPIAGLEPPPPGPTLTPPFASAGAPARRAGVISMRRVTVRSGVVQLQLSCARAGSRCVGGVQIETTATVALRAGSSRRRVVLGRARYSIAAARSAVVRIKLSSLGRRLLARSRTVRTVVSVTPRGAARPSARRSITLRGAASRRIHAHG